VDWVPKPASLELPFWRRGGPTEDSTGGASVYAILRCLEEEETVELGLGEA
jgi:hypothetical protein